MRKVQALRRALAEREFLVVPTAYDAMSARRIEGKGFPAVHVGGFLGAAALLGMPDVGLLTASEAITRGANIANTVDIPVILDVDNGWGNAINVIRTVRDCVRNGIAAVHIEDQEIPKRCGQYGRGQMSVVSREEMAGKIRAAKDHQDDPDFFIIARTDAIGAGLGVDGALDRIRAYADAGADALMVISRSVDMLKEVGERWDQRAPLVTAPTRFAHISAAELYRFGYRIVLYTEVLVRAAIKAVDHALDVLARDQSAAALENDMVSTETLYEIVRLDRTVELERRYVPGA